MKTPGLITRIAILVMSIEIAAFSALGWFYIDRFSIAAEQRLKTRLHLISQMIGRNELAVSTLAEPALVGDLLGAPYLGGLVIGGSGRVIVAADPDLLGRPAAEIPGLPPEWLASTGPVEQTIAGPGTLTGIMRIHGSNETAPIYRMVLTLSTAELEAQKRSIAWWGGAVALLFVLFTTAAIILVAQRLITRRLDQSLAVLRHVGDGAFDSRIEISSNDELGQLQQGINTMTDKVVALLDQHRRAEEEMATILDALTDGVIAVGSDGAILRCNRSARLFLGAVETPPLGRPIGKVLPDLPLSPLGAWWTTPQSLTSTTLMDFEHQGTDGQTRVIELGHGPIKDADGSVMGAVLVLQDITRRRQGDLELRAVVERLTVSNSELERFAYVASHDLQEPLRTITSFTQLLERRLGAILTGEDRENFGFVVTAAKRMSLLITDLLAYSRVNTRGVAFSSVSLQGACSAALDNLHETIAESLAEIEVAPLPNVTGDAVQLMQVFQNLIGNAIKFHRPEVPPRITVSAERQGAEWIIDVADNGIGIAPSEQDIFEIFRRLHTAATYPGSGVGLAICKRIVQRHNGRIWFDTRINQGTVFHFALPAET